MLYVNIISYTRPLRFTCCGVLMKLINIYWAKLRFPDRGLMSFSHMLATYPGTRITPICAPLLLRSTWHRLNTANPNNGIPIPDAASHHVIADVVSPLRYISVSTSRVRFAFSSAAAYPARLGSRLNARHQGLDGTQKPQSRRSPPDWYGITMCRKFSYNIWIFTLYASCDPAKHVTHTSFRLVKLVYFGGRAMFLYL